MAFKYGTTSPTEIIYNGTSLTNLKYGDEFVWGKPYTLSISQGANTTVTVNRTSSPNQQANLGNLSDGSVVYYGDVLIVTYSIESGYEVDEHTINGNTLTSSQTVTVTEAMYITVTAKELYSWHILWTGSKYITANSKITTNDRLARKYRATITTINETWSYEYYQVIELDIDTPKTVYGTYEDGGGDIHDETCGTLKLTLTTEGLDVTIYGTFADRTGSDGFDPYTMIITKLEGYY